VTGFSTAARAAISLVAMVAAVAIGGPVATGAALSAVVLTAVAMPLFRRYALARPNARSSHSIPIPQGGGAAVVAATILFGAYGVVDLGLAGGSRLLWMAAAVALLALVGAVDDISSLPVLPRLGLQFAAAAMVVLGAMAAGRILPVLPFALEAVILIVGCVWFVNLTNFIDGIDGITLAGFMPLAAGGVALASLGYMTPVGGVLAIAFLGALAGFAWFNLPRASLFLGDVGSLPIGLIGAALLIDIAQQGALAAAVILPLYPAADATTTLFRRLLRREKVWEAHRQHAYQNAVDGGWSHARVSGLALLLNCGLAGLALLSVRFGIAGQIVCVGVAAIAVTGLIVLFRSRKRAA
jgi:UDP-N-acetylmuramyl pentapeptide phosphotransferase/UDP-N-acetylglucosamine-1-phosphate transferase